MALADKSTAFHALHAVYHERDFRVRVNDPTQNFVRRILVAEVGSDKNAPNCPACAAGYDYLKEQPNKADREG